MAGTGLCQKTCHLHGRGFAFVPKIIINRHEFDGAGAGDELYDFDSIEHQRRELPWENI
jgi:hypothetical protein